MYSKNSRGYNEEDVPEKKRFRANLSDAFLSGQITAARTASLFKGAQSSGASGVDDLAAVQDKNAARSLRRKMLKGSHWPDCYYADIELHDPKLQENRQDVLQEDAELIGKFSLSCQPARDPATFLPLGLWNDGVPCNWDRSQSLEVIALSFPSIPGLRVPLFCLKKMFEAKKCTMDAAMKVLVWSFEQLALGRYPSRRHDGSPFDLRVDKARLRLAGSDLPVACLTQIRGDWKMFKDTLSLPAHNENNGCCWLCPMTPDKVHEVDLQASWRHQYFDQETFIMRCWEEHRFMSAVWQFPNFCLKVIRLDWLHIMDLGCAADAAGNVLYHLQSKMPGSNITKRTAELYKEISQEYKNQGVASDRLATLTETMYRKEAGKAPKLKAKGAETRKLIPILDAVCRKFLDSSGDLDSAVLACISLLLACYAALDVEPYDPSVMEREVRKTGHDHHGAEDWTWHASNMDVTMCGRLDMILLHVSNMVRKTGHGLAARVEHGAEDWTWCRRLDMVLLHASNMDVTMCGRLDMILLHVSNMVRKTGHALAACVEHVRNWVRLLAKLRKVRKYQGFFRNLGLRLQDFPRSRLDRLSRILGAHTSRDLPCLDGMATGSANPGQTREQLLMRLLQTQQEQMGQLQRLLEQGQRPRGTVVDTKARPGPRSHEEPWKKPPHPWRHKPVPGDPEILVWARTQDEEITAAKLTETAIEGITKDKLQEFNRQLEVVLGTLTMDVTSPLHREEELQQKDSDGAAGTVLHLPLTAIRSAEQPLVPSGLSFLDPHRPNKVEQLLRMLQDAPQQARAAPGSPPAKQAVEQVLRMLLLATGQSEPWDPKAWQVS
ncbi:unnamed protein product [Symbiodinium sp. CCMP2592]|nr:unnamed protein product [Symbiodinium sp. CCMP2592]